jgi:hypothetical protein
MVHPHGGGWAGAAVISSYGVFEDCPYSLW